MVSLKLILQERHITNTQLAKKIHVTRALVTDWIGQRKKISEDRLKDICSELRVTRDMVVDENRNCFTLDEASEFKIRQKLITFDYSYSDDEKPDLKYILDREHGIRDDVLSTQEEKHRMLKKLSQSIDKVHISEDWDGRLSIDEHEYCAYVRENIYIYKKIVEVKDNSKFSRLLPKVLRAFELMDSEISEMDLESEDDLSKAIFKEFLSYEKKRKKEMEVFAKEWEEMINVDDF